MGMTGIYFIFDLLLFISMHPIYCCTTTLNASQIKLDQICVFCCIVVCTVALKTSSDQRNRTLLCELLGLIVTKSTNLV